MLFEHAARIVAFIGHDNAAVELDRMPWFIGEMRRAILHLGDFGVGIGLARPIRVREFLALAGTVEPDEIIDRRRLDADNQKAFIEAYRKLLNSLGPDEAVLFLDAVHPKHAARPVGCWAPAKENLAIDPRIKSGETSARQRLNIHGAIDFATGNAATIGVESVDAASTIRLLEAIEAMVPLRVMIHVFLGNARYHHAKIARDWLAQEGRRVTPHFVPAYCPRLNPIERLWGVMHKHLTHNKCHATYQEFAAAALTSLRQKIPKKWPEFCDSVTDNFRVINPKKFPILTRAGYKLTNRSFLALGNLM